MAIARDKTTIFEVLRTHIADTHMYMYLCIHTHTLAYIPTCFSCIYIHLHSYLSVAVVFLTVVVKGLVRSALRVRRSLFSSQFEGIIPSWWGKHSRRKVRQLAAWCPPPGSRMRQMLLLRSLSPFSIF